MRTFLLNTIGAVSKNTGDGWAPVLEVERRAAVSLRLVDVRTELASLVQLGQVERSRERMRVRT